MYIETGPSRLSYMVVADGGNPATPVYRLQNETKMPKNKLGGSCSEFAILGHMLHPGNP